MIKKFIATMAVTAVTTTVIMKHKLCDKVSQEIVVDTVLVALHVIVVAKINRKS